MLKIKYTVFNQKKYECLTLEATYKENDVYGRPLGGIYHSDLINGISDMACNAGLEVEIGDMFAVNNLDGSRYVHKVGHPQRND